MSKHSVFVSLKVMPLALLVIGCAPSKNEMIKEARSIYDSGRAVENTELTNKIVLVRISQDAPQGSGYDYDVSGWLPYYEILNRNATVSSEANIYFNNNGKLSSVHITDGSLVGDWLRITAYYYRSNGTLALMLSEHRGYWVDPVSKEMEYIYNKKGVLIDTFPACYNLETRNPANKDETSFINGTASMNPAAIYLSASLLLDSMNIRDMSIVKNAMVKKNNNKTAGFSNWRILSMGKKGLMTICFILIIVLSIVIVFIYAAVLNKKMGIKVAFVLWCIATFHWIATRFITYGETADILICGGSWDHFNKIQQRSVANNIYTLIIDIIFLVVLSLQEKYISLKANKITEEEPSLIEGEDIYCSACYAKVKPGVNKCPKCGIKL